MNLTNLATPSLILDRPKVVRNAKRMSERLRRLGVSLRPHVKTAKSAAVAKLQTEGWPGGITVSTLAEAAYFAARGYLDQTYAVSIIPAKLAQADSLVRDGVRLSVVTDSPAVARALVEHAAASDVALGVLVEIDTGGARAGVLPESADLVEIASILTGAARIRFEGVLTHAGHSYHCRSVDEIRQVAEAERAGVVRAAERLRALGLACPRVSAGSTPTAVHAQRLDGVSEMRPGVYIFGDLDQAGLGSCAVEDIAISVLASVIGHYPAANRLIIDAGGLALSKDISANEIVGDAFYGWVSDVDGRRIGNLSVRDVHQEHGLVSAEQPLPFDRLPIGSKVRILPNHACMTAAAYDRYHVIDGGSEIIEVWDRVNGWQARL